LKISAVKAYAEVIPLPRPFHGSNYTYVSKKAVFLEVATDEGISGFAYLGDDFSLGKEKLPNRGFLRRLVEHCPNLASQVDLEERLGKQLNTLAQPPIPSRSCRRAERHRRAAAASTLRATRRFFANTCPCGD